MARGASDGFPVHTGLKKALQFHAWTLGLAVGLLLAVALLAAWIPSRRAAKVDPMVALRYE